MKFKAWIEWHKHPKWTMSNYSQSATSSVAGPGEEVDVARNMSVVEDLESNKRDEEGVRRTPPLNTSKGLVIVARNAKLIHQEEL